MVIDNYERIVVEKSRIPLGARLVEAYITKDNEVVICGEPEEQPGEHDCDVMGCATFSHVIFRGNLKLQRQEVTSVPSQNDRRLQWT